MVEIGSVSQDAVTGGGVGAHAEGPMRDSGSLMVNINVSWEVFFSSCERKRISSCLYVSPSASKNDHVDKVKCLRLNVTEAAGNQMDLTVFL